MAKIPGKRKPTKAKVKTGRPTKYKAEYVETALEYIRKRIKGKLPPTVEGLALHLGVHADTLYEWGREHKEFSVTLGDLKMYQKDIDTYLEKNLN